MGLHALSSCLAACADDEADAGAAVLRARYVSLLYEQLVLADRDPDLQDRL